MEFWSDDTLLVSYPKSGNTWIRFLIANMLKDEDERIDFHSVVRYVPELGYDRYLLDNAPRPRVIKSHSLFTTEFPRVLYIVRDPRDVYVSYYHYLRKRLPEDMSFGAFLRKPDLYPSRWHEHVESWLGQPNVGLVLRYEDLLVDVEAGARIIAHYLWNGDLDEDRIRRAVNASSFEAMKESEWKYGRPFRSKDAAAKATPFVRKGQQGDWKNYFSSEDLAFLLDEAGLVMHRLEYE